MTNEAGKGDKQRPTNYNSYSNNYDLIWGKKDAQPKTTDRSDSSVQEETREDIGESGARTTGAS
jgi:hypothetical protein